MNDKKRYISEDRTMSEKYTITISLEDIEKVIEAEVESLAGEVKEMFLRNPKRSSAGTLIDSLKENKISSELATFCMVVGLENFIRALADGCFITAEEIEEAIVLMPGEAEAIH